MICGWVLCSLYETRATSEAESIERTAIGSVLVEFQLTTNRTKNPKNFLGVFL